MSKSELVRIADWNNARSLCKEFGFRYGLVFAGNTACYHRLAVKTWAHNKLGFAAMPVCTEHLAQEYELRNSDSDWFCGFIDGKFKYKEPYYIVFKEKKYRDFALLL